MIDSSDDAKSNDQTNTQGTIYSCSPASSTLLSMLKSSKKACHGLQSRRVMEIMPANKLKGPLVW